MSKVFVFLEIISNGRIFNILIPFEYQGAPCPLTG
jgi:hypothetical protein